MNSYTNIAKECIKSVPEKHRFPNEDSREWRGFQMGIEYALEWLDAQEGKEPVVKPLEDHAFVGDTQEPLCMECDEPLSSHKAQEKPVGCGRGYALPYPSTGWAVCNENQQCRKCTKPTEKCEHWYGGMGRKYIDYCPLCKTTIPKPTEKIREIMVWEEKYNYYFVIEKLNEVIRHLNAKE